MDLSKSIETDSAINAFISTHFFKKDDRYKNPIFPYKVEYVSSDMRFSFCNIPILRSWAFKNKESFTFYLIVTDGVNIIKSITAEFGKHTIESTIQINNDSNMPQTYYWNLKKYNIILKRHLSENLIPTSKKELMIIFGNIKYKKLFG